MSATLSVPSTTSPAPSSLTQFAEKAGQRTLRFSESGKVVPPEDAQRQAAWDEQIQSLDQKEIEIHQSQTRLIREQMATFLRDLGGLREEVRQLSLQREGDVAKAQAFVETVSRDKQDMRDELSATLQGLQEELLSHGTELKGVGKLLTDMAGSGGRLEEMHGRVSACEAHSSKVCEMHKQHTSLGEGLALAVQGLTRSCEKHDAEVEALKSTHEDLKSSQDQHRQEFSSSSKDVETLKATVSERLAYIEQLVGDSADRHNSHSSGLETAAARLEHLHQRLAACETQGSELGEAHSALADEKKEHHATFQERLDNLEQRLGGSMEKHALQLETLKAEQEAHSAFAGEREQHHATLQERLDYIEKRLGDSAEKHVRELETLKATQEAHSAFAGEREEHHATLQERLDFLEKQLGDSVEKHALEMDNLRAGHEVHAGSALKHSQHIQDLGVAAQSMQVTLQERIEALEQVFSAGSEQHQAALAEAQAKVVELHEDFGGSIEELQRAHGDLQQEKEELRAHHSSLKDRLDGVDRSLGKTAEEHAGHLQALQSSHDDHLEAAGRHADGIEQAHTELQSVKERLASFDRHGVELGQLQRSHDSLAERRAELEAKHASMAERIDFLEKLLGDSADKHVKESSALKALPAKTSIADERLERLESSESLHRHSEELWRRLQTEEREKGDPTEGDAGESTKDLEVQQGVFASGDQLGEPRREPGGEYIDQAAAAAAADEAPAVAAPRYAIDDKVEIWVQGQQQWLAGRVAEVGSGQVLSGGTILEPGWYLVEFQNPVTDDWLHKFVEPADVDKVLRGIGGGVLSESLTSHTQHASLLERIEYLEGLLNQSSDRSTQAHSRLDEIHSRVAACEKVGPSLQELRESHVDLADSRQALTGDVSALTDRIENMESAVGDATNRHAKELRALKASHEKQAAALSRHDSHVDAHAPLPQRVSYLEERLGDSADQHAAAMVELHHKIAQEQASREAHHGSMKELLARDQEDVGAHHASTNERLDYLESIIGDAADKHAQEIAEVASSVNMREGQHRALTERVVGLEQGLLDAEERLLAEVRATRAKADAAAGRIAAIKEAWTGSSPRQY